MCIIINMIHAFCSVKIKKCRSNPAIAQNIMIFAVVLQEADQILKWNKI